MNIQQYLRDVTPLNVLDILDVSVLDNLLNGYSFALGSGITVVYPTTVPATLDTLDRRDALGSEHRRTLNPLCAYWRDPRGCGREQGCLDADKREALKYFNGTWSEPKLYRCQPLGLWDMTFPLRIGEHIIGILFGGQIVVEDVVVNWREALYEHQNTVDWTTCPDQDSHYQTVQQNIITCVDSDNQRREMLRILHTKSIQVWRNMPVDDLRKRIEDFLRFGRMTQQLIDELHKARKTAAEHQLLSNYDHKLAGIELTEPTQWWEECGRLLYTLTALSDIQSARLYVRERSHYRWKASEAENLTDLMYLEAREVVPVIPIGQLVSIPGENNNDLVRKIALGQENVWGYRSETGAGREVCSTLVVLRGVISEGRRSFLADLCSVICTYANLANLIFRERDVDEQYRRKVNLIGHSFRTPLQAIQFELEDLETAPPISTSPELLEKVRNGLARIRDTREDLFLLLESAAQEMETFDLVEVLLYVLNSMEPIAKKHPCTIVRQGAWPEKILVQAIRYRVQRALTCLLDNAIKYSYYGQHRDGGGLYEVRIGVVIEDGYVKTIMRNYGIGVPKDKLQALGEYGFRGEIADKKKPRLGTGRGLPFAIDVFEESGGWIHVTNSPADSASEQEKKSYHRYITTVEAALPIARRE
jgi:signal transduction histidine kinase